MNRLQKFMQNKCGYCNFNMVKTVMGGTRNLLDKREKRIDKR